MRRAGWLLCKVTTKDDLIGSIKGGTVIGKTVKSSAPIRSDVKLSKLRNIQSALDNDRDAYEASKPFSLMQSIREFPWKFFISFMAIWTWAGWYLIPVIKGLNPDGSVQVKSEESGTRQRLAWKATERRRLLERQKALAEQKALLEAEEAAKAQNKG